MEHIKSQTVVTLPALACTVFLSQGKPSISKDDLVICLKELATYVIHQKIPHASQAADPNAHVKETLRFFERNGWARIEDGHVHISTEMRRTLDFHKNTILHYLLPPAIEGALLECAPASEGSHGLLQELLAHEFLLKAPLTTSTWLTHKEHRPYTPMYSGLIRNYLEAYDLAARFVMKEDISEPSIDTETTRKAITLGEILLKSGELKRSEAISSANLQSSIAFLYDKKLLQSEKELQAWHDQLKILLGKEPAKPSSSA